MGRPQTHESCMGVSPSARISLTCCSVERSIDYIAPATAGSSAFWFAQQAQPHFFSDASLICLLYTSDAADE